MPDSRESLARAVPTPVGVNRRKGGRVRIMCELSPHPWG